MSLRGQFANWPWQSASPFPSAPCLKGAARRSRDWGILFLHFLQPIRRGRCPHRPERFFSHPGRAHGPCPTRCCVIGPGRTGSTAPTNRSVGRDPCVPLPPALLVNGVIAKPVTGVTGCGNPSTPPPKMLFPSRKKGAPPPGRAPFQTDSIHQKSALPTVRGCSSTSRMLLTPVRYMTIRSKPRPKPACLQVP